MTFQFTHPGKGATWTPVPNDGGASLFQFTHPGKGATLSGDMLITIFRVSIHAPWEGCDAPEGVDAVSLARFNSRTLGRVRLKLSM